MPVKKNKYLTYPRGYEGLAESAVNGCGPDGWKIDIVPDRIWGLNIRECCNIHDAMYFFGKDDEDRKDADDRFLHNLIRVIDKESSFKCLARMRKRRAWIMYKAVRAFGGDHF